MIALIGLWIIATTAINLVLDIYDSKDQLIDYVFGIPMILVGFWMVF